MFHKIRAVWQRVSGWLGPVLLALLGLIFLITGVFQLKAGQIVIGLICVGLGYINFQITRKQRRSKGER